MEAYATKDATVAALEQLGFTRVVPDELFFDSPKNDEFGMPVVQAFVYQCPNKYWCVDLEGAFRAPIVWSGPQASWDTTDTTQGFIDWLDQNNTGWR